ncbi:MAG: hypothetical protein WA996_23480 [Candidatus Promineifilaceae bacterium]
MDPEDEDSIAEGILTVLRDEEYRQELSQRGLERATLFSWDKAAREKIDIYHQVLNSAN